MGWKRCSASAGQPPTPLRPGILPGSLLAAAAAHTDHAREMVRGFIEAAKGEGPHQIKDVNKLMMLAKTFDIATEGREINDIALELGQKALAEFGKQENTPLSMLKRAPAKRQALWKKLGIEPRGVDREVVEMMHRTHMGVDQDYENLTAQASRCALADGWGSSMLSTELTDIMFGTPVPRRAIVDLGVLKPDQVNVTVHGHEPLLAEALCIAASDPEMLALAKKAGANGINLAGVCCTGNEILMRRGIPVAAGFVQQEMALATGAIEAMVVDVQCVMQSVADVAKNFHTDIITTNYRAKMPGGGASAIRRERCDQFRQKNPETRHRQLQETGRLLYSRGEEARCRGRLQPRDHQLHAGRQVPVQLPAFER